MRSATDKGPRLPPGPKTPKLWNLLRHALGLERTLKEFRARYGDIFYYGTPLMNFCFLFDPELIRDVFTVKGRAGNAADGEEVHLFGKLPPPEKKLLFSTDPRGALDVTHDEQRHRRLLGLMDPGFNDPVFLEAHAKRTIEELGVLHQGWTHGKTISLVRDLTEFSMSCMFRMNMGTTVGELRGDDLVRVMKGYQQDTLLGFLPGTAVLRRLLLSRKSLQALESVDSLMYRIIQRAHASSHDPHCMVTRMIQADGESTDQPRLHDWELRDILFNNFTISVDPLAITLVRCFGHLSASSEARTRLEREVDEVLGNQPLEAGHYDRLPYAKAVFQETLRLDPPAYLVTRLAKTDHVLNGFLIPQGTWVECALGGLHRDPRYWDRPDEFWPERWLEDSPAACPVQAYLPFGFGTRQCTAEEFSTRLGVYLLASTAQRFRLDLVSRRPLGNEFNQYMLSVVKGAAKVRVHEREMA